MANEQLFHVNVGAIVRRGNEILIMKRAVGSMTGAWYFPGGDLELNESPEEGVRREIIEETGFEVEDLRLFRAWHTRREGRMPTVALTCVCTVPAGAEPALDFEHSAYQWIDPLEFRQGYFGETAAALAAGNPGRGNGVEGSRAAGRVYRGDLIGLSCSKGQILRFAQNDIRRRRSSRSRRSVLLPKQVLLRIAQ